MSSELAPEEGSASEPMPFAIDLLAGVEILLTIAALGFLGFATLARSEDAAMLPPMEPFYPRVFREPGPTALALLAGPPLLIAIGLFLRKPWGRYAAITLHVSLGLCAVWHCVLRLSANPHSESSSADLTIVMLFLFAQSVGVPLFLNRRHMRAAFARGRR